MGSRTSRWREDLEATGPRDESRAEPEASLSVFGNRAPQQLACTPQISPALLSALGNQGVQRALVRPAAWSQTPPIQRVTKPAKDLLDMTVGDFARHRKTEQMDWANATGFDEPTRQAVWEIIDWGLEGLSEINLREAAKEVAKKSTVPILKYYCEALTGTVAGFTTLELRKVDTIAAAVREGKWVAKLTVAMGVGTMRAVMPLDV